MNSNNRGEILKSIFFAFVLCVFAFHAFFCEGRIQLLRIACFAAIVLLLYALKIITFVRKEHDLLWRLCQTLAALCGLLLASIIIWVHYDWASKHPLPTATVIITAAVVVGIVVQSCVCLWKTWRRSAG